MRTISRQYPALFKPPTDHADTQGFPVVLRLLDSPLAFFMKTEGPERDPTWVQSLPNEAQRCFCKHALDIAGGLYQPEIRGALSSTSADTYSVKLFQKGARVSVRFTTPFRIACDSLIGLRCPVSVDEDAGPGGYSAESAGSNVAASAGSQQEDHAEKNTHESTVTNVSVFRNQCEQHCARELEARMVYSRLDRTPGSRRTWRIRAFTII
jgi:hypothetical protein